MKIYREVHSHLSSCPQQQVYWKQLQTGRPHLHHHRQTSTASFSAGWTWVRWWWGGAVVAERMGPPPGQKEEETESDNLLQQT